MHATTTSPGHTNECSEAESVDDGTRDGKVSAEARVGPALASIAIASFVLGSAELVVVGVLNLIAGDLSVSVGQAGLLVTQSSVGSGRA
jgi:hypothetical protein